MAEALGVAFQQVQKYENGRNPISAGTLHELSRLLDALVQFFSMVWVASLAGAANAVRMPMDGLK